MLYQKALRVTLSMRGNQGIGGIVNLQSNDASKLWGRTEFVHFLWSAPFQLLTTMVLLVRIIGWEAAFAALGVALTLIPLNMLLGMKIAQYREIQLKFTDQRVKLTTEVITGVDFV